MQLQEVYWAEQKLAKTLPALRDAAASGQLKTALNEHLQQTRMHVSRLEAVFQMIGEKAIAQRCPSMAGITEESTELTDSTEEGTAQREMALLFTGQKVKYYKIAAYGGLLSLAKTLGYKEGADTLAQTLAEEKEAEQLLINIAEQEIKYKPAATVH